MFPIKMPPLRERKEDIPMLAQYFIDWYASKNGKEDMEDRQEDSGPVSVVSLAG